MYELDFSVLLTHKELLLSGIIVTLKVCCISLIFAFFIGVIISYCRCEIKNCFINKLFAFFVEVIRNTPLLIQIYIVYKVLPQLGIVFNPFQSGVLALSIFSGVYISEVLRSGINSVGIEQRESALSLGFNNLSTFYYIIFPQAIKHVISPLGSQFINLIKNSSLVSFISVTDIFYVTYKQISDDFRIIEYFLFAAIAYMGLTGIIVFCVNLSEILLKLKYRKLEEV